MSEMVGGIEAGGTKFVCAIGTGPDDIRAEVRFPTTNPEETIGRVVAFFREQEGRHGRPAAIGIGAFGPIDPNPNSLTYGHITSTPKPGWANVDLAGRLGDALNVPFGFDTDVNVAALGEWRWGMGRGLSNFIYLTVGTGIGGGVVIDGRPVHGLIHPELGHIPVRRDPAADPYPGRCPYHGDCLEGLAAGPAIGERWGRSAVELPPDHPAWELEAGYLAQALHAYICILSPERIILGGGVMEQLQLFPSIRRKVREYLNGYVQSPAILSDNDDYIVPPLLGNRAGIVGAFVQAQRVIDDTYR